MSGNTFSTVFEVASSSDLDEKKSFGFSEGYAVIPSSMEEVAVGEVSSLRLASQEFLFDSIEAVLSDKATVPIVYLNDEAWIYMFNAMKMNTDSQMQIHLLVEGEDGAIENDYPAIDMRSSFDSLRITSSRAQNIKTTYGCELQDLWAVFQNGDEARYPVEEIPNASQEKPAYVSSSRISHKSYIKSESRPTSLNLYAEKPMRADFISGLKRAGYKTFSLESYRGRLSGTNRFFVRTVGLLALAAVFIFLSVSYKTISVKTLRSRSGEFSLLLKLGFDERSVRLSKALPIVALGLLISAIFSFSPLIRPFTNFYFGLIGILSPLLTSIIVALGIYAKPAVDDKKKGNRLNA